MSLLDRVFDRVLGARMQRPADLTAEALPARVTLRAGRLVPAIGGILGRMRGPAAAVTLRRTIVVHPHARLTQRLLLHELEHVRQWEQEPLFAIRYTMESLRHGYRNNRYERQARDAENPPGPPFPEETS